MGMVLGLWQVGWQALAAPLFVNRCLYEEW